MTHTLTQFNDVERIKLWMNGHELTEMPVEGTPISEGYSRANGINIMTTTKPDVLHSEVATVFFPKQQQDEVYYVPVTQYFDGQTTLLTKPNVRDGVVQLEFSEHILQEQENAIIANDVMETLVRTLTEQEGIEAVEVMVNDETTLLNEEGLKYEQPVTAEDFT